MYGYRGPRSLFRRFEIMRHIRTYPKDWRVLEIGAGTLGLTADLAARFVHVTAIDLAENIHAIAATLPAHLQVKIDVQVGDFLTLPLDQTFDLVIACEVLEHVEQDQAFVKKMRTLLKPNGHIIISVPAHMKYWAKDDELVGHVRRYSREDLEQVASWIAATEYDIISYGFPWLNLLRIIRIRTAALLFKDAHDLTPKERTIESGQRTPLLRIANRLIRHVITPLASISRLFNTRDLSDGYLLIVRKRS